MKSMILAAGLGTRLRPLTDTRPKALVEVNGRTLLEITIARLRTFGVTEVIINVHHFADMVIDYLKAKNNFGMRIEISREDDLLLDTGGGLKKAAWFFLQDSAAIDQPFLLHNVDVISRIDFHQMIQYHTENGALATLAVQSRESSRQLLFTNHLQLSGRRINNQDTLISPLHPATNSGFPHSVISSEGRNLSSHFSTGWPLADPHPRLIPLAFSGIHVISPRLLPMLTETGVFSIIDSYLRLASEGERILALRHDHSYWRDLGKPTDLAQAAIELQKSPPPS